MWVHNFYLKKLELVKKLRIYLTRTNQFEPKTITIFSKKQFQCYSCLKKNDASILNLHCLYLENPWFRAEPCTKPREKI